MLIQQLIFISNAETLHLSLFYFVFFTLGKGFSQIKLFLVQLLVLLTIIPSVSVRLLSVASRTHNQTIGVHFFHIRRSKAEVRDLTAQ